MIGHVDIDFGIRQMESLGAFSLPIPVVWWLACKFVMPETWVQIQMGSNLESAQIIPK